MSFMLSKMKKRIAYIDMFMPNFCCLLLQSSNYWSSFHNVRGCKLEDAMLHIFL